MAQVSAGILLYRRTPEVEVFLAHPGGPFWSARDEGAWTIPKGLIEEGEDYLAAAIREFEEETGIDLGSPESSGGRFMDLGTVKQKSGKLVYAWGCERDADPAWVKSNDVNVKWQGRWLTVPEVDRCEWFDPETAMRKANPAQAEFILRLIRSLG